MIFDQAFHTRDTAKGLGIYASSNNDVDFKRKCESICEGFYKEEGSSTAEFVCYSNSFEKLVGIGITPSDSSDKTNKVAHIWVPREKSYNPSDYYLYYKFSDSFTMNASLETMEISPCISEKDYRSILEKYDFSKEALRQLLFKVFLIISGEKDRLCLVFQPDLSASEEKRTASREIMWLLSMLIPVTEERRKYYYHKLTYSVFAKKQENRNRVAIAFADTVPENEDYYLLGTEEPFSGSSYDDEVFEKLAEKAMDSLESYREFVSKLSSGNMGGQKLNRNTLRNMYFYLKLREGKVSEIRKKELPLDYNELIRNARKSKDFREYLFRVITLPNDLDWREFSIAYLNIYEAEDGWSDPDALEEGSLAQKAYENMMESAFEKECFQAYDKFLVIGNPKFKKAVLTDLWEKNREKSCIARDVAKISNEVAFSEKLTAYETLLQYGDLQSLLRDKLFEYNWYFDFDKKKREYISNSLGDLSECIKKAISKRFQHDIGEGLCFIKKETDNTLIEKKYATVYFHCFVINCEEAQEEYHEQIQQVGHDFLRLYVNSVNEEDLKKFNDIDRVWKINSWKDKVNNSTINELAGLRFDFSDYSKGDQKVLIRIWREGVAKKTSELVRVPDAFMKIADRHKEVEKYSPDDADSLRKILWEACAHDLKLFELKTYCSHKFGITIWSDNLFDIAMYRLVLAANDTKLENQETQKGTTAELNQSCYQLWKTVFYNLEQLDWGTMTRFNDMALRLNLKSGWSSFLKKMMSDLQKKETGLSSGGCVNYWRFWQLFIKGHSLKERYCEFDRLYGDSPSFFVHLTDQLHKYAKDNKDYIEEMKQIREVHEITQVSWENLSDVVRKLKNVESGLSDTEFFKNKKEECDAVICEMKTKKSTNNVVIAQNNSRMNEIDEQINNLTLEKEDCKNRNKKLEGENDKISKTLKLVDAINRGEKIPQRRSEISSNAGESTVSGTNRPANQSSSFTIQSGLPENQKQNSTNGKQNNVNRNNYSNNNNGNTNNNESGSIVKEPKSDGKWNLNLSKKALSD